MSETHVEIRHGREFKVVVLPDADRPSDNTPDFDLTLLSGDARATFDLVSKGVGPRKQTVVRVARGLGVERRTASYRIKQLEREIERIKAGDPRPLRCVVCGEPFPPGKNAQATTCGVRCRVALSRSRKRQE